MYKGLGGYWRRKGYVRIDGSTGTRRKNRVELASTNLGSAGSSNSTRRRRFWRIKITPKLKFFKKLASPKKILSRLRDSYVNMMLGFANSSAFSSGFGGVGGSFDTAVCYGGGGGGVFGKPQLKEYDEKVLVEFYRSLMAQGTLMPRDAAKIAAGGGGGGGIACRT